MVLAKQKDTQRRLYEEIVKYSSSTGPITLDDIGKMPYFNAFLREVLRLYPPVGQFFRYNANDNDEVLLATRYPGIRSYSSRLIFSTATPNTGKTHWSSVLRDG